MASRPQTEHAGADHQHVGIAVAAIAWLKRLNHSFNLRSQMPENKGINPSPSEVESTHELEWVDESIPRSAIFGDTYYSRAGGLAETGHVFIGGNGLTGRWPQMRHCIVAELGFGTGLNFLETVRCWQALRPPGGTLDYIGFEAFPISRADLRKSLSRWPELTDFTETLASLWTPQATAIDVTFVDGVRLIVHFADANAALPELNLKADAWYLDGFAPARNPQLWSGELMALVFARTAPAGSFATYTAAGWVRRNLQAAGFIVEKVPGFAGKREMMRGVKPQP
jgi:tRNA U34 5-methylaminomethyl-2-thiouridine-forming methyltransferase MnmC